MYFKRYFGFAISDSMFSGAGDAFIVRTPLKPYVVRAMAVEGALMPCLNPSHKATIEAMKRRFGIEVEIPETPPKVSLGVGDAIVVMQVNGLPRLTDRHEYTEEEIAHATFTFAQYQVVQIERD